MSVPATNPGEPEAYEPPLLTVLGDFHELTLRGCFHGKELGGTDGFSFTGFSSGFSNCSA